MKQTDWRDSLRNLMPDAPASDPDPTPQDAPKEAPKPLLRIEIDRKRAGKTATIISGFDPDDPRAPLTATELKRRLAIGGSTRDGEILLQGDCADKAAAILKSMGYKSRTIK